MNRVKDKAHREFWLGNGIAKTCLEKIYFTLLIKTKLGKKEFLKLYIVLLRAGLNCTIYASRMGRSAGAS